MNAIGKKYFLLVLKLQVGVYNATAAISHAILFEEPKSVDEILLWAIETIAKKYPKEKNLNPKLFTSLGGGEVTIRGARHRFEVEVYEKVEKVLAKVETFLTHENQEVRNLAKQMQVKCTSS